MNKPFWQKCLSNESVRIQPEGAVFIVGDNWSRSLDSLRLGPISQSLIKGKVIGIS